MSDPSPEVSKSIVDPHRETAQTNTTAKSEQDDRSYREDRRLVRATYWSVIASFFVAVGTAWLAWTTHSMANGTNDLTELTRQTANIEDRAYVGFKNEVVPLYLDTGAVRCEFTFTNAGRTPAYDVAHYCEVSLDTTGFRARSDKCSYREGQIVGPSLDFPIANVKFTPDPKTRAALLAGSMSLYYCTSIRYKDVFGDSHYLIMYDKYRRDLAIYEDLYTEEDRPKPR